VRLIGDSDGYDFDNFCGFGGHWGFGWSFCYYVRLIL
jgi:hypothetical protein